MFCAASTPSACLLVLLTSARTLLAWTPPGLPGFSLPGVSGQPKHQAKTTYAPVIPLNPSEGAVPGGQMLHSGRAHFQSQTHHTLSQESMEVVSGLIESFMHKVKLLPGEKTCLQRNFGVLAGDVMGVGRDVVTAVKGLIPDPRWSAPRAAEHRQ